MRRGQANTEFIIVVALIAIATIGVVSVFGNNLRSLFGGSADALAGADNVGNPGRGGNATKTQLTNKTIATFGIAQSNAYNPQSFRGGGSSSGGGGKGGSAKGGGATQ